MIEDLLAVQKLVLGQLVAYTQFSACIRGESTSIATKLRVNVETGRAQAMEKPYARFGCGVEA